MGFTPPAGLDQVFATQLSTGNQGMVLFNDSDPPDWRADFFAELSLAPGDYDVGVWVDADRPEAMRRLAIVLGPRHRAGSPTPEAETTGRPSLFSLKFWRHRLFRTN